MGTGTPTLKLYQQLLQIRGMMGVVVGRWVDESAAATSAIASSILQLPVQAPHVHFKSATAKVNLL